MNVFGIPRSFVLAVVLAALLALPLVIAAPLWAAGPEWTVVLTREQAEKAADIAREPQPTVFALSPDGAWGRTWGMDSVEAGRERALAFCRERLKPGRSDCIIYAVNGKVVVGPTVAVPKVSKVYKPLNPKKAAAHFGLADVTFRGNVDAAAASFAALEANPTLAAQLPRDRTLEAALTGRSLTNASAKYFAIWFDGNGGEQHTQANSVLVNTFEAWVATPDGLVCMLNSRWKPSGKFIGTRCLVIRSISRGAVEFSWLHALNVVRKGYAVAGNALYGAAK